MPNNQRERDHKICIHFVEAGNVMMEVLFSPEAVERHGMARVIVVGIIQEGGSITIGKILTAEDERRRLGGTVQCSGLAVWLIISWSDSPNLGSTL